MYTFEMDKSEAFVNTYCDGEFVGKISPCGVEVGNVNFSQNLKPGETLHRISDSLWEEFDAWWDTHVG